MNEACSALEIEFKRVSNDLEYVSHRLETEFRSRSDVPDVVSLIRRIHELESSLIETKRKSQDLLSRRRILANKATSLLLSNHSEITQLIDDTGCQSGTSEKKQAAFQGDVDDSFTDDKNNSVVVEEDFKDSKGSLLSVMDQCQFIDKTIIVKYLNVQPRNSTENEVQNRVKEILPAMTNNTGNVAVEAKITKIESSSEDPSLFEITVEQFEKVPASVRGRCKLVDVQQVLTRLQTYYATVINSNSSKKMTISSFTNMTPLSTADLALSGLKVVGKTGDCVLATLRTLGIIKIGKSAKPGILLSDVIVQKLLRG